ncbi:MAG: LptF/LptG family permease, partial [Bacteroidales bacterium]|nr:LptF/LptG family permease [Bacteroidales bacterium]
MKRLDRFIVKSFLLPFIAILLVVVFILMMQFLWLYIDELVGKGLALRVILEFMMWGTCTILPLALPLATLLASMMTVGQMGENNELMAIKSAGVPLTRVMAPLMVMSAIICLFAFYAGNSLVPRAYNEIFTLRDDIGRTKSEIKIPSGVFYEGIEGYILRVDRQDKQNGMLHGVMVYDHSSGKGNTSLTLADSAMLKMSPDKNYLIFTLYDGANYKEDNVKKYRDTTLQLQHLRFTRQQLIIPLRNYSFEKSDSSRFGDQIKCQNVKELAHLQDSLSLKNQEQTERHYISMSRSNWFTMRTQLDTAAHFTASERFSADNFCKWSDLEQESEALRRAAESADRMAMDVMTYDRDVYEYNFYLSRASIELLKKYAQALACLILFFIGAPLGALIRKGGLGTSAIVSVLFFVLYWVVDISGTKLARDGAIDAFTGAFISA